MTHLLMCRPYLETASMTPLPSGYSVRTLRDNDDLRVLATTLSLAFDYPWDAALIRSKLVDAPDVNVTFVGCYDEQLVATASSRYLGDRFPNSGYVHWVGTHPNHTRSGLAGALTSLILDDFRTRGYTDAILETDDFRIPAISTYMKYGFTPVYAVGNEDHRLRWSHVFQALYNTIAIRKE